MNIRSGRDGGEGQTTEGSARSWSSIALKFSSGPGRRSKEAGQTRGEKGAVHAHAQRVVLGGGEDERGLGRELRSVETLAWSIRNAPITRTSPDAVLDLCERAVVLIAAGRRTPGPRSFL